MEVLTPQTLDEALAMKAERRDAVPIQGGTDVMVELNFARTRPPALLDLTNVPELSDWADEDGGVRIGQGPGRLDAVGQRSHAVQRYRQHTGRHGDPCQDGQL